MNQYHPQNLFHMLFFLLETNLNSPETVNLKFDTINLMNDLDIYGGYSELETFEENN